MKGKIIFEEVQSFVGTWMWYLIIGLTTLILAGLLVGTFLYPVDPPEALIGSHLAAIVMAGIVFLFATSKLYVSIDNARIYYRFPPFVSKEKFYSKDDVQQMQVRKYRPILEYGGYGYRRRFRSGRAMNITGNMGLQLVLKNGKKVLIGTQKPDLMKTVVKRLQENWNMNG
ncbi:MAG: hypothetical protein ABJG78_00460 [Cyclobacteriaceae bacterium]